MATERDYKTDGDILNCVDLRYYLFIECEWDGEAVDHCTDAVNELMELGLAEEKAVDFVSGIISITAGEYGD